MSSPIILVTGANRGIGFAIVHSKSLRVPNAIYILACRSQAAGSTAIQELKKLGVTAPLEVVVLDVTDDASILAASSTVKEKYGKLDSSYPKSKIEENEIDETKFL
jgi:NAD(P)-dependent dehydrogenase (short-subunit alcohol dehydrogenase family)